MAFVEMKDVYNVDINYIEDYIEKLTKNTLPFDRSKAKSSDTEYGKTRYGIVVSALNEMLQEAKQNEVIATVINIALDIFFVAVVQMGVAGVALATIIAQIVSAILCFIRLARMRTHF